MRAWINGGCTPSGRIGLDYDENPNGLPVVWLQVEIDGKRKVDVPLDKEAVSKLTIELQRLQAEM